MSVRVELAFESSVTLPSVPEELASGLDSAFELFMVMRNQSQEEMKFEKLILSHLLFLLTTSEFVFPIGL